MSTRISDDRMNKTITGLALARLEPKDYHIDNIYDEFSESNIHAAVKSVKDEVNKARNYPAKEGYTFLMDWTRDIQYKLANDFQYRV